MVSTGLQYSVAVKGARISIVNLYSFLKKGSYYVDQPSSFTTATVASFPETLNCESPLFT